MQVNSVAADHFQRPQHVSVSESGGVDEDVGVVRDAVVGHHCVRRDLPDRGADEVDVVTLQRL